VRFSINSDANVETRIGEATRAFSAVAEYWFIDRNYGLGLDGVGVLVTCRNSDLNFKQRTRLYVEKASSKSWAPFPMKPGGRYLDMDLMLDYDEFVREVSVQQYSLQVSAKLYHTDAEREKIIRQRIVDEVPAMLRKYATRKKNPLKDFDVDRFERDLRKCLLEGGVEEIAPAYEAKVEKEQEAWLRHKEKTGRDILLPGETLPE
jgi:hypothetical protein